MCGSMYLPLCIRIHAHAYMLSVMDHVYSITILAQGLKTSGSKVSRLKALRASSVVDAPGQ